MYLASLHFEVAVAKRKGLGILPDCTVVQLSDATSHTTGLGILPDCEVVVCVCVCVCTPILIDETPIAEWLCVCTLIDKASIAIWLCVCVYVYVH